MLDTGGGFNSSSTPYGRMLRIYKLVGYEDDLRRAGHHACLIPVGAARPPRLSDWPLRRSFPRTTNGVDSKELKLIPVNINHHPGIIGNNDIFPDPGRCATATDHFINLTFDAAPKTTFAFGIE